MAAMLQAQDLECILDFRTLFSGLSFPLQNGDAVQVEDPNGAGKPPCYGFFAVLDHRTKAGYSGMARISAKTAPSFRLPWPMLVMPTGSRVTSHHRKTCAFGLPSIPSDKILSSPTYYKLWGLESMSMFSVADYPQVSAGGLLSPACRSLTPHCGFG